MTLMLSVKGLFHGRRIGLGIGKVCRKVCRKERFMDGVSVMF